MVLRVRFADSAEPLFIVISPPLWCTRAAVSREWYNIRCPKHIDSVKIWPRNLSFFNVSRWSFKSCPRANLVGSDLHGDDYVEDCASGSSFVPLNDPTFAWAIRNPPSIVPRIAPNANVRTNSGVGNLSVGEERSI